MNGVRKESWIGRSKGQGVQTNGGGRYVERLGVQNVIVKENPQGYEKNFRSVVI